VQKFKNEGLLGFRMLKT